MNKLHGKSPGLKKVMQPRMAYKYAPRDQSSSELLQLQASSQYAFSGRKISNLDREQALYLYKRRAQSIGHNGSNEDPAAGPSSGKVGNVMINDNSATQFEEAKVEADKEEADQSKE